MTATWRYRAAERSAVILAAALVSLALPSEVHSQEPATEENPPAATVPDENQPEPGATPASSAVTAARPDHLVVLRFSRDMLASLVNKPIDRQAAVSDIVLGTPVRGTARIVARPHLELQPSANQARFQVTFTGSIVSRTIGYPGEALIHGRSVTYFTATKEIVFEPGQGFSASPPQVAAQTQCYTDGITTSRGGIVGCIMRKRAWRELAARQPQLTAIARQRAIGRIAAAFDNFMAERIARLNRVVEMRRMLAGLSPEPRQAALACSTKADYLEIADAGPDASRPIALPAASAARVAGAPIEIWLHGSIVPERLAEAMQRLLDDPEENALVSFLSQLPDNGGAGAAAAVTGFLSESYFAMENVENWLVIEILPEARTIVRAPVRLRR